MFLVVPEVGAQVAIADFVRFGAAFQYHVALGLDLEGKLSNKDFTSPAGLVFAKFGRADWPIHCV